ncbi:hypothetical protein GCM10009780_49610 [Actinomadura alba]
MREAFLPAFPVARPVEPALAPPGADAAAPGRTSAAGTPPMPGSCSGAAAPGPPPSFATPPSYQTPRTTRRISPDLRDVVAADARRAVDGFSREK